MTRPDGGEILQRPNEASFPEEPTNDDRKKIVIKSIYPVSPNSIISMPFNFTSDIKKVNEPRGEIWDRNHIDDEIGARSSSKMEAGIVEVEGAAKKNNDDDV